MYLSKLVIKNIRSISRFEMNFSGDAAGWHVIIGDNGAGKSSVVRAISAALIGPDQIAAVLPVWEEWLSMDQEKGLIELNIQRDRKLDEIGPTRPPQKQSIVNCFEFKRIKGGKVSLQTNAEDKKMNPRNFNWGDKPGWFSVAFGPFRRFTGGDDKRSKAFYSAPKAGAHLSVFGEDIALTEALDWLKELDRRRLKELSINFNSGLGSSLTMHDDSYVNEEEQVYEKSKAGNLVFFPEPSATELVFENLKAFINQGDFLPHSTKFMEINLDGEPVFTDGNNHQIKVTQLSDGFRSILSLCFELIRQLVAVYSAEKVFPPDWRNQSGDLTIDVPGLVLIDEIDAHLHPSWQTRIGQWFTRYFPKIQFIVTTHSPLVCRACNKGSIWRLAAPGSNLESGEVTGAEREKLIYGNILDAYGTEIFGVSPVRSVQSHEKLQRLGRLNMQAALGKINAEEEEERINLQQTLSTDAPTG